jgi:type IV secretion system protein VirB3
MAASFRRDTVFLALTRPQMFAGVTYSYFVINAIVSLEVFLIFKSFLALVVALVLHLVGMALCLREPRFFDLWLTRVSRCPRVRNYRTWGCNSYSP